MQQLHLHYSVANASTTIRCLYQLQSGTAIAAQVRAAMAVLGSRSSHSSNEMSTQYGSLLSPTFALRVLQQDVVPRGRNVAGRVYLQNLLDSSFGLRAKQIERGPSIW